MVLLTIFSWFVVGAIVGLIMNKTVNLHGDDPRFGMGAGIAGATVAGIVFAVIRSEMAWNLKGMMIAAIGAIIAATIWHLIRRRSAPTTAPTFRRSY